MIHKLGSAARAWFAERCLGHAAGIAFYTVLSLSPFLVLALAAASFLVDRGVAIAEVHTQLRGLVGAQGADLVANMIESANATHNSGVAAVVALAATLFGATAAIAQLKFALDELFCARDARNSVRQAVRVRLIAVVTALVLGVLVVASLIASTLARMAIGALGLASAFRHNALLTVNEVISLAVVIAAFYGLLRFLPSEPLPRGATWRGALTAGVLFEVAKFGIGVVFAPCHVDQGVRRGRRTGRADALGLLRDRDAPLRRAGRARLRRRACRRRACWRPELPRRRLTR